jgi:hypothetical protein
MVEFSEYWDMQVLDTNNYLCENGFIHHNSGKSYSVAQKHLIRIVSESGHRILVARKVARTLRVSVFQLFKDLITENGLYDEFKINKSDMTITYTPNGNQLLFFGLDDIEKLKSIQGISSIWVEEASECEQNDIAELNRRLRGHTESYKQIILTFNPISHLHWIKEHFFDNPASTASIYKSTYLDNAFIDDEYREEIESIKHFDMQQYRVYALGEWGVLNTNVVYHNFKREHRTDLTIDDFGVLHCGIDFNVGGCAVVMCGIRGDVVHVVDSFVSFDTDGIVADLQRYRDKDLILYPDASGGNRSANAPETSLDILRKAGFYIDAPKANGPVRDRINSVNKMFALDRVLINDKNERLIFALETQGYKDNGDPEKFTDHKKGAIDDWNDGLGYFIVRRFPIKDRIKQIQVGRVR